jgi:hypothetical protein
MSGYLVTVIAYALGLVSVNVFLLLVALAILYGLVLTLGAAALEDATTNRHPAWSDLRRILLYAVVESLGYRQLMHIWRIEGFWQVLRKTEWGTMERKGLSETLPIAPAPGTPAARRPIH